MKLQGDCMKFPACGNEDGGVIDSRETTDGLAVRRRRKCDHCDNRFTTYETVPEIAIKPGVHNHTIASRSLAKQIDELRKQTTKLLESLPGIKQGATT